MFIEHLNLFVIKIVDNAESSIDWSKMRTSLFGAGKKPREASDTFWKKKCGNKIMFEL